TYSLKELHDMLDKAVDNEDYEKGALIRDEISKREKKPVGQMFSLLFFIIFLFVSQVNFGQSIEKTWSFSAITDTESQALFEVNPETDTIVFNQGKFRYSLSAKDNLEASGDYILQNNLLVLFYTQPN